MRRQTVAERMRRRCAGVGVVIGYDRHGQALREGDALRVRGDGRAFEAYCPIKYGCRVAAPNMVVARTTGAWLQTSSDQVELLSS